MRSNSNNPSVTGNFDLARRVDDLFDDQVKRRRDKTAVVFGQRSLSYRDLDERASLIAANLFARGCRPSSFVAFSLFPSPDLIACMLAAMKLGAAYTPIDPTYPAKRVNGILETLRDVWHITCDATLSPDAQISERLLNLNSDLRDDVDRSAIDPRDRSRHLYCMFTSGTTGQPKGALIRHDSFVNLLNWYRGNVCADETSRVLVVHSFSFDATQKVALLPLVCGGTLYLNESRHFDPRHISQLVAKHEITIFNTTPTTFSYFSSDPNCIARMQSLRYLTLIGEPCVASSIKCARELGLKAKVINHYGPTECTDVVSSYELTEEDIQVGAGVPIGKPIANTQIYVLNAKQRRVPPGVRGEIYVAGRGVCDGYVHQPVLSTEAFLEREWPWGKTERLYRTGDLGRINRDGLLEYLGRADDQIKLRGIRIELDAIRSQLNQLECVKDCVIDVIGEADLAQIVAYVVPADNFLFDGSVLKAELGQVLPNYMVPTCFVRITALPRTTNGKVDKRALPAPGLEQNAVRAKPKTATEKLVAKIWERVLNVENISLSENFFYRGGHSLIFVRVIAELERELGKQVSIAQLFDAKDLQDFCARVDAFTAQAKGAGPYGPQLLGRKQRIPLSPLQRRLLLVHKLEPGAIMNNPAVLRISGDWDQDTFVKALQALIEKHELLRSRFYMDESGCYFDVGEVDWHSICKFEKASSRDSVASVYQEELNHKFDLERDCPVRVRIVQIEQEATYLIFNEHHLVSDRWSRQLILGELVENYVRIRSSHTAVANEAHLQFADYCFWTLSPENTQKAARDLDYWEATLSGLSDRTHIYGDFSADPHSTRAGKVISRELDANLAKAIHQLCEQEQVTPYIILLASFAALMGSYAGTKDVVLGSPFSLRSHPDLEGMVGFFVNTIVQRIDLTGLSSFRELLLKTKSVVGQAYDHAAAPFDEVVARIAPKREPGQNPIFDIEFAYHDFAPPNLSVDGLHLQLEDFGQVSTQFDLSLDVEAAENKFLFRLKYDAGRYTGPTASGVLNTYIAYLDAALQNLDSRLTELRYLPDEFFRPRAAHIPGNVDYSYRSVIDRFKQVAEASPASPAAYCEGREITYGALARQAGLFAKDLLDNGVRPGEPVGLLMNRSIESLASMLGIMRMGGVFVALDLDYPFERLRMIVEDCDLRAIVCRGDALAEVRALDGSLKAIAAPELSNPFVPSTGASATVDCGSRQESDLCYLIYTSGTTGKPKGFTMHHGMLSNLIAGHFDTMSASPKVVAQNASLNFDVCFEEIFNALCTGGRVEILSNAERHSPKLMLKALLARGVEVLFTQPFMLQRLAEEYQALVRNSGASSPDLALREIVVGGAQLQMSPEIRWLLDEHADLRLHNNYGPSETHAMVRHTLTQGGDAPDLPPIGRAMPGNLIYVLSEDMQPVPRGAPGELYIGGVQLSPGYWARPRLTAEKFVPDPFGNDKGRPGCRLYRSGDLVRETYTGEIQWLARIDHMVKVRGYRIELAEIEHALRAHPNITDVVAQVVTHRREDVLVAYIQYDEGLGEVASGDLRRFLLEKLPRYCLPNFFVRIPEIPLSSNKKIDLVRLPTLDFEALNQSVEYLAPVGITESQIARMWEENLCVDKVGRTSDYFELGGDSLKAMLLKTEIDKTFGIDLNVKLLFQFSCLAEFAERVESAYAERGHHDDVEILVF